MLLKTWGNKWKPSRIVGMYATQPLGERVWQFLKQLNTILPHDPASPLLLSTREK